MTKYGRKMAIYQLLFFGSQPNLLAASSEAITFDPIEIQTRQAPQNDRLNLSFVKDKHTVGDKMARNDRIMKYTNCHLN